MTKIDIAIVGGGIIGLATSYELTQRFPALRVTVMEKESHVGAHQTGHNSGVLHSGIYYKPGSLKALNCRAGKQVMERFCENEGIPYERCGKVIVAANESEVERLERIFDRGQQNGVECELIDADRLHELEPHAAGVQAVHVPEAGIVNYRRVCERLAEMLKDRDGDVMVNARVTAIDERNGEIVAQSQAGDVRTDYLINCAGLHCDRVARLTGHRPKAKIVPFRGEFFKLKADAEYLCRNLIYPVPDPSFPFLGVHFTKMIDGGVECGPNAVLAMAREGYHKTDINLRDIAESLSYPGFLRLASKYWRVGAGEMWRSMSKSAFVRALQRLMPEIRSEHLVPARSGVRAQAITPDGAMVDDFLILPAGRIINVNNAPSPAATSAFNVAKLIVDELAPQLS